MLLNNTVLRKANWNGYILRRNYLLHDGIEEQMAEAKRVGRRIIQLLVDLRNRKRYWELKEEAENRKGGNDSLSHEGKKEIKVIYHKSMYLLTSNIKRQ